ncbi:MAG: HEPN domain-containing protein [Chloroflexi bacterium]|nr:HEPN domain-containing protein [Chloroflexota bacterium]
MIDIEKQVESWRDGAREDWEFAQDSVARGKARYGLFFAHLALEKIIKAHVCRVTLQLAPKIHNLKRLADLAQLQLNEQQIRILGRINAFNIEGRYPDSLMQPPSESEAKVHMADAKEMLEWLMKQL